MMCKLYLYLTELFEIELLISIKMDLALNNLQWLMYHKTKPNQNILIEIYELCFIHVHIETNSSCCLLQAMK